MTANVNIEIARRTNVLRIPNAALRFRPTKDIFEALHQTMPPEMERGFGRGQGQGRQNAGGQAPSGQPGAPGAPAAAPTASTPASGGTATTGQAGAQPNAQRQGGQSAQNGQPRAQGTDGQPGSDQNANSGGGRGSFANMTPEQREERRKRMEERMAAMSPEERAQFQERIRQRQQNGGGGNFTGNGAGNFGGGRGGGNVSANNGGSMNGGSAGSRSAARPADGAASSRTPSAATATTIDSLFAPLPQVETRGRAWLYINKELKMVTLRLGISDGTFTEVINDTELQPDMDVVTSVVTPEMASRPANQQNQNHGNPLMPQRGPPGGPAGGVTSAM